MKLIDHGEPSSLLDNMYLRCTQRERESDANIVDTWVRETSRKKQMRGHLTSKVMQKKVTGEKQKTGQLYEVSTPFLDDHNFKKEELESVGELSNVCSQIVLKCLYLARVERPDILSSLNKLARAVTKWIRACHKRSGRLVAYNHHTKLQIILPCGCCGSALSIGLVPRLRLCWRP